MSFLAPAFLVAAGLVAGAVVAIHFIVTREPRMVPLPTARFAPARPVRARARTLRPQDLLLMLLRVLLVLAVGAALAQPVLHPSPRPLARIVLADRSRAVADPAEVADSARALLAAGDALVLFDGAATVVRERAADSLAALESPAAPPARGRLSPALVAALRTASAMRASADSLELAIVSPLVAEEVDAATDSLRALWPGGVRLVPVAARRDTAAAPAVAIDGPSDDPLRAALSSRPGRAASVRIVRGVPDGADSAWAAERGRALVHWPAKVGAQESVAPPGQWKPRASPDTIGAVAAGDAVVVAPFVRRAIFAGAESDAGGARVVARWVDGEPAAVESSHGEGCIRSVAVDVPSRGDLVLSSRFARFVGVLTEPCGGRAALEPIDDARLAALAGPAGSGHAAASAFAPPESVPLPLVPWLLGAALLFAAGALLLQRRITGADAPGAPGAAEAA